MHALHLRLATLKETPMPTERIAGPLKAPCQHREHFPPSAMVYRPGTYQHRCPGCGHVTTFFVDTPIW